MGRNLRLALVIISAVVILGAVAWGIATYVGYGGATTAVTAHEQDTAVALVERAFPDQFMVIDDSGARVLASTQAGHAPPGWFILRSKPPYKVVVVGLVKTLIGGGSISQTTLVRWWVTQQRPGAPWVITGTGPVGGARNADDWWFFTLLGWVLTASLIPTWVWLFLVGDVMLVLAILWRNGADGREGRGIPAPATVRRTSVSSRLPGH